MLDDSKKFWIESDSHNIIKTPIKKLSNNSIEFIIQSYLNKIGNKNDEIKEKQLEYKTLMTELDIFLGEANRRRNIRWNTNNKKVASK